MSRIHAASVFARTNDLLRSDKFMKSLKLESINGILPAILTYPIRDFDGDIVVPDGGDWSKYPQDPVVNWEHAVPVGRGTVQHHGVPINGVRHVLPIGNTTFFEKASDLKGLSLNKYDERGNVCGKWMESECLDIAEQAYEHVSEEIVSGVSLEFDPTDKEKIGKSLRLNRPAYQFNAWRGLGWAHTANPVNKRAGLISVEERAEKAMKALNSGRNIPDIIRKSLTATASLMPSRAKQFTTGATTMARYAKAFDDTNLSEDPPDETGGSAGPSSPRPTEAALLDGAQALLDAASMLETSSQSSEHAKGKKHLAKVIGLLQGEAAKMQSMAETIKAELDGNDDEGDEEESEDDTELADDEGEPELETDDEGAIQSKSFKGFIPRRFVQKGRVTVAELQATKGIGPDETTIKKSRLKELLGCEKLLEKTVL